MGSAFAATRVRRLAGVSSGVNYRGLSTRAPMGVRRGHAERGQPSGHLVERSGEQREVKRALRRD